MEFWNVSQLQGIFMSNLLVSNFGSVRWNLVLRITDDVV